MVTEALPGVRVYVSTPLVMALAVGVAEVMGHPDVRSAMRRGMSLCQWSSSIGPTRALIVGPGLVVATGEDAEPMGMYAAFEVDASSLPGLAAALPPVPRRDPPPPWLRPPAPPVDEDAAPRSHRVGRRPWRR